MDKTLIVLCVGLQLMAYSILQRSLLNYLKRGVYMESKKYSKRAFNMKKGVSYLGELQTPKVVEMRACTTAQRRSILADILAEF